MKNLLKISALVACLLSPLFSFASPLLGAFPQGNYDQSCFNCNHRGNTLSCQCKGANQIPHFTSLYVPQNCRYIENINGNLACTQYRHHRHHHHAFRQDVRTGPIMNQFQANQRCPRVCYRHNGRWTGNWNTVVFGRVSVCGCKISR